MMRPMTISWNCRESVMKVPANYCAVPIQNTEYEASDRGTVLYDIVLWHLLANYYIGV